MNVTRYRGEGREDDVDAAAWDGSREGASAIINWILQGGGSATYRCGTYLCCLGEHAIAIRTPHGIEAAHPGDWVLRRGDGHYPQHPQDFTRTYTGPADDRVRHEWIARADAGPNCAAPRPGGPCGAPWYDPVHKPSPARGDT